MSWLKHAKMAGRRYRGDGKTRVIGAGSAETPRYKNTTGLWIYDAFHQSFHANLTNPARLARRRIKVDSSKRDS
jgi:hypothetical protein